MLVQQQWLPTILTFKLFQTSAFVDFLNQCSEIVKACAITLTVNEIMADFSKLDLTGYDGCDPKSICRANDDLMGAIYRAHLFPFLDSLRSSNRLITF